MYKLLMVIGLFLSSHLYANTLQIGDNFSKITLLDQHEHQQGTNNETQILLFSRDMKSSDLIQEALKNMNVTQLPATIVYIADISKMPSLIAKFVAIPQLKDLRFAIALDKEGSQTQFIPSQKKMASVIILDKLAIKNIHYLDSAQAIQKVLQPTLSKS